MFKITVQCGYEFDKDGKRIHPEKYLAARTLIMQKGTELFDGITVIDTYGAWKNDKDEVVTEKGWKFESFSIYTNPGDLSLGLALFIRDILNQASVIIQWGETNAKFI